MLGQEHRLLSVRNQTVSRHTSNLVATTDKSPKGEAAFLAPAKAAGFHAATNHDNASTVDGTVSYATSR
ncbi:hypothetical protein MGALJ_49850 [Mycobacterium gallinarum]|uniref:Uncharacterized protein n=1 Tax=Mycobacterium gallinarum TaxID=39689 RepID=A0A9W4B765_9MYCO|nr:hypothetical protein MGALJ_49850 [Mycobacterium gallinarum]